MGDSQNDNEKLFLFEVLVDSLSISTSKLNLDRSIVGQWTESCVLFQFLHYPPLVVCECDFLGSPVGQRYNGPVTFKSGKSCFFSLRCPRGSVLPTPFIVKVSVAHRLGQDLLPDKLEVGKTSIDMSDAFTELLKLNPDNCEALPLSRTKKGVFELKNDFDTNVGQLTAFLRLSCFGKLIITQFSLNKEDEKSYLFKGTKFDNLCGSTGEESKPCDKKKPDWPSSGQSTAGKEQQKQQNPLGFPLGRDPKREFSDMGLPQPPLLPGDGFCGTGKLGGGGYGGDGFGGGRYDGRRYQEEAKPCCCQMDFTSRSPPFGQSSRPRKGTLCEYPYTVPPGVMSKYSQSQRTDKEKNLSLAPGDVGIQDDQVIFQLPLKRQGEPLTERDKMIDSSVYYKLTSAEDDGEGKRKNTVHIKSDDLPGMAADKGAVSPVSGLPVDDQHDVFLLKIGKKCDGDKKRNLELELRTPKMKEPKAETRDQDTQYVETDLADQKDKGKGKEKKGGKGKGSEKGSKKGKKGKK